MPDSPGNPAADRLRQRLAQARVGGGKLGEMASSSLVISELQRARSALSPPAVGSVVERLEPRPSQPAGERPPVSADKSSTMEDIGFKMPLLEELLEKSGV